MQSHVSAVMTKSTCLLVNNSAYSVDLFAEGQMFINNEAKITGTRTRLNYGALTSQTQIFRHSYTRPSQQEEFGLAWVQNQAFLCQVGIQPLKIMIQLVYNGSAISIYYMKCNIISEKLANGEMEAVYLILIQTTESCREPCGTPRVQGRA